MLVFIFCRRDYLNIIYEHDQKSKVYCGNKTGWRVEVTGNYIMIRFHSDHSHQKRGFLIYFIAIPPSEYYPSLAQKRDMVLLYTRMYYLIVLRQFCCSVLFNQNSLGHGLLHSCAIPPRSPLPLPPPPPPPFYR